MPLPPDTINGRDLYGVQVGVFAVYENAVRLRDRYSIDYGPAQLVIRQGAARPGVFWLEALRTRPMPSNSPSGFAQKSSNLYTWYTSIRHRRMLYPLRPRDRPAGGNLLRCHRTPASLRDRRNKIRVHRRLSAAN